VVCCVLSDSCVVVCAWHMIAHPCRGVSKPSVIVHIHSASNIFLPSWNDLFLLSSSVLVLKKILSE
jgi:hypothetical protein